MGDHAQLSADDLNTVRQALKCPAEQIQSEAERSFLKSTRDRLKRFGEGIYLSTKQLEWLRNIAARAATDGGKRPGKAKAASSWRWNDGPTPGVRVRRSQGARESGFDTASRMEPGD